MRPAIGRFELGAALGSGSFGVVRAAWDRELQERVALKLLRRSDLVSVAALKAEYRLLADVWHPNLVAAYGLFVDPRECMVSMELVDGSPLVTPGAADPRLQAPGLAVPRGDAFTADPEALRRILAQAVGGIAGLHDAGIIHGDIKPSHLLVTRDGRVKIIDFGLGQALAAGAAGPVGTPAWAAPEIGSGGDVTPAADWYSLGVVLYQALTGQLPFGGDPVEVTVARQTLDPLPPDRVVSGVPPDLASTCMELLRRAPSTRPGGAELLRRLGASALVVPGAVTCPHLVGRDVELATLVGAMDDAATGKRRVLLLSGPSGVGKTRLVRQLLAEHGRRCLVFSSASNLHEMLPYKCLDSIVDALVSHMGGLTEFEVTSLLPEGFDSVVELFPMCSRVLPERRAGGPVGDPAARRSRAAAALQAVLERLAGRQPILIVLDDAQWADPESAALLAQILEPPDHPAVMVVACTREGAEDAPVVQVLRGAGAEAITLRELPAAEAEHLAELLLGSGEGDASLARHIGAESCGMPSTVELLAQHARAAGGEPRELSLEAAVAARAGRLSPGARRVLQLVAVAGRPVERGLLRTCLGDNDGISAIWRELLGSRLVSERMLSSGVGLELRHGRYGDGLLADMDSAEGRALRDLLAGALAWG